MRTDSLTVPPSAVVERTEELYSQHQRSVVGRMDRLFATLMLVQWACAIVVAAVVSPYAWEGQRESLHIHVYAAVFLGGLISSLPAALGFLRPGRTSTRYVLACAQILWSALLIHLTGGRIETHFHVFGSLAFVAFYRDWKVLLSATLVVTVDHLARQLYWPESVYGMTNPEWWRFAEHTFWVVFEDTVLVLACLQGQSEMREIAQRQALVEHLSERERQKAEELAASQEALVRVEKLAAVGQLAASVGHELRNPLTAVRNASAVLHKRLADPETGAVDSRYANFLGVIERELKACTKIIGDLLDFARERPAQRAPCPLAPLVDEVIQLLPPHTIEIRNEVPLDLPAPSLDRDQFRQVLLNLLQNAVEAVDPERADGRVTVGAKTNGAGGLEMAIEDTGAGMSEETRARAFEPLFTTKVKGTGLGMAIVAKILRLHEGTISIESEPNRGTRVALAIPARSSESEAA